MIALPIVEIEIKKMVQDENQRLCRKKGNQSYLGVSDEVFLFSLSWFDLIAFSYRPLYDLKSSWTLGK